MELGTQVTTVKHTLQEAPQEYFGGQGRDICDWVADQQMNHPQLEMELIQLCTPFLVACAEQVLTQHR
jgi:hypothetical protein